MDVMLIVYITRHSPPETLEGHVLHSRWVQEVRKKKLKVKKKIVNTFKNKKHLLLLKGKQSDGYNTNNEKY